MGILREIFEEAGTTGNGIRKGLSPTTITILERLQESRKQYQILSLIAYFT